jgi:hypothetical protein
MAPALQAEEEQRKMTGERVFGKGVLLLTMLVSLDGAGLRALPVSAAGIQEIPYVGPSPARRP